MDGAPYKLEPIHQPRPSVAMMPAPSSSSSSARPPRSLSGGIAGPRARGTSQEEIRALLRRTTLALDRIVRIRESMEPFVDFAQFDKPPRPSAGRRSSAASSAASEPANLNAATADARSTPASSYGSTASSSSLSSDDPDTEIASTRSAGSTRSTALLHQSSSLSVTDEDELLPSHATPTDNRSTSGGRSTTNRSASAASSLSRIEDDEDDEDDDEEEEVPPFKEGRLERLKHIEITFVEGLPREFYMALARFLFSVVDVKTRHSRFNFYKDAFTGADAVREMVLNGFCDDQQTALRYGNVLVRLGLVEHVSRTEDQLHNSKDNFYRFTKLVEAQVGVGDASDEFARDTVARSRRASSVAAYRESVMASRESAAVGNLVEYDFTEATDEVHALVTDEALLILSKVLLKVFERKNKLLFYKGFVGCFLGAEAVNVLRELRIATSLIDAVLIGQAMLDEALIEPIASSAAGSFQDKYVFYRLTKAAAAHGAVPPMTPPTSLSVGARPPSSGSRPPSVSSQSSAP